MKSPKKCSEADLRESYGDPKMALVERLIDAWSFVQFFKGSGELLVQHATVKFHISPKKSHPSLEKPAIVVAAYTKTGRRRNPPRQEEHIMNPSEIYEPLSKGLRPPGLGSLGFMGRMKGMAMT